MKICLACKVEKPLSEFHKNGRGGFKPNCKDCRSVLRKKHSNGRIGKEAARRAHLQARYGITPEQKTKMYLDQGGRCAICKNAYLSFDVDHCHETGIIRGLLCRKCNMALGLFSDNIDSLLRAVEYLRSHDAT